MKPSISRLYKSSIKRRILCRSMIKISIISPEISGRSRAEGNRLTTGGSTANKTFSSDLFRPYLYILLLTWAIKVLKAPSTIKKMIPSTSCIPPQGTSLINKIAGDPQAFSQKRRHKRHRCMADLHLELRRQRRPPDRFLLQVETDHSPRERGLVVFSNNSITFLTKQLPRGIHQ